MRKAYILTFMLMFFYINCVSIAAELPETITKIKPSIVGVGTVQKTRTPPAQLLGTGFVIGNGLLVVTNAHVLSKKTDTEHNEQWVVFIGQGPSPQIRKAEAIKTDPVHDLVILKIGGEPLPALQLRDSDLVREGDLYAFTGFPIGAVLGLYPVTHNAMVSAITPIVIPVNRSNQLNPMMIKKLKSPFNVFQLDATAYPGNSGSPLFEKRSGMVIGVVNMVFVKESKENVLSKPSGIAYAIPSNFIKELLTQ
jgi:serine protease Do